MEKKSGQSPGDGDRKQADQDEEAGDPVFTVCDHASFGNDSGTRDAYAGRSE